MALCRNGNDDDHDDEDDDDVVEPVVGLGRSPPGSRFYDPRHARPIATVSRAGDPPGGWGDFAASYLDEARAPVPPFPRDALPSPWRGGVREPARAAAAPADYVALSLIAAVGGLCGAGVRVQV